MIENIAIIPARGGSKRIKNKNIVSLAGKPLIEYTLNAAENCFKFDVVVVSTDSPEIAKLVRKHTDVVVIDRPAKLATDTATTSDVIIHAMKNLPSSETITLLQPTSPLRTSMDIRSAFKVFHDKKANSVVSVCPTRHSPLWSGTIPPSLSMDKFLGMDAKNTRSQDIPQTYVLNGAIYIAKSSYYLKHRDWYAGGCYAYIMPPERSIDIDTEFDLKMCECIMKGKIE